nr:N-6 DNA methylase [Bradyrhizobium sp. SZCCHNS3002]
MEEETGEFDDDGNQIVKRRKADDEHLIRKALLQSRLIDAVISLPLNVFYGAGVPACLLILRKQRPPERHDKVLLVYAARHYRELSNQNELRPQDVMRILVHVQAYGEAARVPDLVAQHSGRIREQINAREHDQVERLEAEYADVAARLAKLETEVAEKRAGLEKLTPKNARDKAAAATAKLENQRDKAAAKIAERDGKIAEARRRADDDRRDVEKESRELGELYGDPDELLKHARVVGLDEIEENEFNLNIPRYVDTFEPEPRVSVKDALKALGDAQKKLGAAETDLSNILKGIGYAT